jgi:hypothetical protein
VFPCFVACKERGLGSGGGTERLLKAPTKPKKVPVKEWWTWNYYQFDKDKDSIVPPRKQPYQNLACFEKDRQIYPGYFFLAGYANDCSKLKRGKPPGSRTCNTVSSTDTILIPVVNGGCTTNGENETYIGNEAFCEPLWGSYKPNDMYARWDRQNVRIRRIKSGDYTRPGYFWDGKPVQFFDDGYWVTIGRPTKGVHTLEVGLKEKAFNNTLPAYGTPLCPNTKYTLYVS